MLYKNKLRRGVANGLILISLIVLAAIYIFYFYAHVYIQSSSPEYESYALHKASAKDTASVIVSQLDTRAHDTVSAPRAESPQYDNALSIIQTSSTTVDVQVLNNTTLLNAGEFEIFFNPHVLSIKNMTIDESLCEQRFIITRIIDNRTGRLFYQCGTIIPLGLATANLSTLTFTVLGNGTSTISFGKETNLYLHDGFGTKARTLYQSLFFDPLFFNQKTFNE